MQKSSQKASILIWTIFLSIIISMAFLGISTKIHKNIKNSGDFSSQLNYQNQIQDHMSAASLSWVFQDAVFGTISLSFEDQNNITRGLWKDQHIEIKLQKTTAADLEIGLSSGWPIFYTYIDSANTASSSWVVVLNNSGSLSTPLEGSIFIRNLWWQARFSVSSNSGSLLPPNMHYSLSRKVGNLNNIQSQGVVTNFISWDF